MRPSLFLSRFAGELFRTRRGIEAIASAKRSGECDLRTNSRATQFQRLAFFLQDRQLRFQRL
jgi:hypothetical protein